MDPPPHKPLSSPLPPINKISKIGVALLVNLDSKCFSSKFTCVLKPQPKKMHTNTPQRIQLLYGEEIH